MAELNDYLQQVKTGTYKKEYLDTYALTGGGNPLVNVVPLEPANSDKDDFFGPKVCNILVINGPYGDFDSSTNAAKARLIATYDKFAKYETHVFVDKGAAKIRCMNPTDQMNLDAKLAALCGELTNYGFTWHGSLESGNLISAVQQVLKDFYGY
jgi:hypothetical protein